MRQAFQPRQPHPPLRDRGSVGYDLQLHASDDESRPAVPGIGNMASGDYFHTLGVPMRAGRTFQPGDLLGTPAVVLSERLAMSIFGTTDVLGRSITTIPPRPDIPSMMFRVAGVVGDVQRERIEDGYTPMAYFPLLRDGDGLSGDTRPVPYRPTELQYVIRGTQLPDGPTIQRIVRELDPRIPAANNRTVSSIVDDATAHVRLTMLLIAVAGGAALLLGVIGVYSVVSYTVSERVREFGIRLAVGASPRGIGFMVLGDGLRLVTLGALTGLVAALGLTTFLRSLLYQVQPTSASMFAAATVLLLVVTLIAMLLPARRAAGTEPAIVLRGE